MSTAKKIAAYLGSPASSLLEEVPFKNWPVEKSFEDDLDDPIIQYVFQEHGLELRCDYKENISAIFVDSDDLNGFEEGLLDLSFSWSRRRVLEHFGTPSKSSGKISDPILGEYGAWDRFALPEYAVHVEYRTDSDRIKKVSFMRRDMVP